MNIALIITSILSLVTLIVSIYNARTLNENKEKDRRIAVELSEKRRMQNDLFEHITKVLDLGRRCSVETDEKEKQKIKFELLNHKIFIWINLDRKNKFTKDLRINCNEYITWWASFLESSNDEEKSNLERASYKNMKSIWILIDKYIEEENKLIEELM
ncbi:hypothetical protein [Bacillus wiedmannii]|uniref:hypothetical protein n=1 Tax=Bacillus wiedmannii TaxID=1890302 RepID=UPI000BF219BC|nr:hypothetical protein [Bacillus wiedmannii]PEK63850.1 hypothetical protein CN595_04670 [Bacillus wiedmannii]PEL66638.1 hypothetical protein CN622_00850 [Bacillus wiedmannii]PEU31510.1 hypothetical protein CN526_00100 [Bacillus wiedmannii]PHB41526.1 hypothetical protein COE82_11930 [Bacillus wiedmannii]PHB94248.1 hypothetical protein COE98_07445 [Bacillus wiedmannii]